MRGWERADVGLSAVGGQWEGGEEGRRQVCSFPHPHLQPSVNISLLQVRFFKMGVGLLVMGNQMEVTASASLCASRRRGGAVAGSRGAGAAGQAGRIEAVDG